MQTECQRSQNKIYSQGFFISQFYFNILPSTNSWWRWRYPTGCISIQLNIEQIKFALWHHSSETKVCMLCCWPCCHYCLPNITKQLYCDDMTSVWPLIWPRLWYWPCSWCLPWCPPALTVTTDRGDLCGSSGISGTDLTEFYRDRWR